MASIQAPLGIASVVAQAVVPLLRRIGLGLVERPLERPRQPSTGRFPPAGGEASRSRRPTSSSRTRSRVPERADEGRHRVRDLPARHRRTGDACVRPSGGAGSARSRGDRPDALGWRKPDPGSDVVRFPRAWPWPLRMAAVSAWLVRNAMRYDVVYATGLQPAAVAGARLAGRPVVVKVVGDLAWERGRRLGLTRAGFDAFQDGRDRHDPRVRAMRWLQNLSLRGANEITAPSETLRRTIEGWLEGPTPVEIIANGVRTPPRRSRRAAAAPFVYVGRLVPHKRVDRIVEAVASVEGARLEILGDGPEAGPACGSRRSARRSRTGSCCVARPITTR